MTGRRSVGCSGWSVEIASETAFVRRARIANGTAGVMAAPEPFGLRDL